MTGFRVGFRVGYLIADKEIIKKASIIQSNICTCTSSLSQYVAIDALLDTNNNKKIRELNSRLSKRLILLDTIFNNYSSWNSEGAFYYFVDIKTDDIELSKNY